MYSCYQFIFFFYPTLPKIDQNQTNRSYKIYFVIKNLQVANSIAFYCLK